eukprot:TRINITY_DN1230_c0_g1_i1.p1 TRINITY_DN1230_c0_g1~~TRINITY_DN1230_c0_g1_i1.p1  ORF type:complete len:970 (+),score=225.94 TRINITY_DN1230_c0_g1_i1:44-2953(+)
MLLDEDSSRDPQSDSYQYGSSKASGESQSSSDVCWGIPKKLNMRPSKLALIGGMTCFAILLVIILVIALADTDGDSDDPIRDKCVSGVDHIRLPTNVIPTSYNVLLQPSFETFYFGGYVAINFDVTSETSCIYIHVRDIDVNSNTIKLVNPSGKTWNLDDYDQFADSREYLILYFDEIIPAASGYSLSMDYRGFLNDDMIGFYKSKYEREDGVTEYMLSTQFQPTYARMAFPSFDEPQLKSVFEISIQYKSNLNYLAIGNNYELPKKAPSRSLDPQVNVAELELYSFAPTVKMSSYLVAFAIGNLTYIEDDTDIPKIRVYTRPSQISKASFSLSMARNVTYFFDDYFQYPYNASFSKMDMIAIPDFAAGAMENWGLITYRETALLMDDATASISDKQYVATVVAHEIAHMTFGNLVTMEWWSDLWLNEAFATYMSYVATDAVIPDWRIFEIFMDDSYQYAMSIDALSTTHPLLIEVLEPGEIEQIFDAITYDKGGSVLRQLDDFLELKQPNWFRDGLRHYVKKFEYANAKTSDLWDALSYVAKDGNQLDIKALMQKWTDEAGFPFVTLERAGSTLQIEQKPFTAFPPQKTEPFWWIPFSYFTNENLTPMTASITTSKDTVEIIENAEWYKANFKHSSFIHVNYPEANWNKLQDVIAQTDSVLGVYDRFGLVGDSFALSRAGHLNIEIPHDMVKAISTTEKEYLVWAASFFHIASFRTILREEYLDIHKNYQAYICQVVTPIATELGWDARPGDTQQIAQLRALALGYAVDCGNQDFVDEALLRWNQFQTNPSVLPPDHRGFVYKLVVAQGGKDEYDDMLQRYRTEEDVHERRRLLSSLGATQLPELIDSSLELSISADVRSQDTYTLYYSVAKNIIGQDSAWEFMKTNWHIFESRYGGGGLTMGRFITATTADFTSTAMYDDVKAFFDQHPVESGSNAIKQSLESIKGNGDFMRANAAPIRDYFQPAQN